LAGLNWYENADGNAWTTGNDLELPPIQRGPAERRSANRMSAGINPLRITHHSSGFSSSGQVRGRPGRPLQ